MPPVRKPRPAHPQSERCRYVDADQRRCRRIATIEGQLCRQCAITVSLDLDPRMRDAIDQMDREFTRTSSGAVADIVNGLLGLFTRGAASSSSAPSSSQRGDDGAPRSRSSAPRSSAPPPRSPPPPHSPPPTPRIDRLAKARETMGFDPGVKITVADVNLRRKKLAQIFHPDAGGSLEHMTRVNAAADALLAHLAKSKAP